MPENATTFFKYCFLNLVWHFSLHLKLSIICYPLWKLMLSLSQFNSLDRSICVQFPSKSYSLCCKTSISAHANTSSLALVDDNFNLIGYVRSWRQNSLLCVIVCIYATVPDKQRLAYRFIQRRSLFSFVIVVAIENSSRRNGNQIWISELAANWGLYSSRWKGRSQTVSPEWFFHKFWIPWSKFNSARLLFSSNKLKSFPTDKWILVIFKELIYFF